MDSLPRTPEEHRAWWGQNTDVPYGFCWCGCGERTNLAGVSHFKKFTIMDCPKRYVYKHSKRQYREEYVVVDMGYETPCWISQRSKNTYGYAGMTVDGKALRAHRVYYERAHGPIPDGLFLDHLCVSRTRGRGGSRACVRPDHLEAVTRIENVRRSIGTKLTAEDAREIRRLYAAGGCTHRSLAPLFGVSYSAIYAVIKRKAWKEV